MIARWRNCRQPSPKATAVKVRSWWSRNWQALALARESLAEVPLQPVNASSPNRPPVVSDAAPDFVKTVTAAMLAGLGDALPVSALPPDGTWPMGTTRWEKRNIAEEIPIWKEALCTQCNPLRRRLPALGDPRQSGRPGRDGERPCQSALAGRKSRDMRGQKYVLQVAPEDCTGCNLCVEVWPGKRPPEPGDQGHQYDVPPGACGRGEGQLRVLPQPAGNRPQQT
ncbi:hypothetical protein LNQ52_26850 [Klebsiella pneumoniae subsp. pneumoniae]|nr:hypothetical protein [Klebsiella pneumoniae subsp. pneumoniae]